jgi:acetyltransferase-like isoleucine patch superfamily enzyme
MNLSSFTRFPLRVFLRILRELRGKYLINKVTERSKEARVVVGDAFLPIVIRVDRNAKFILRGRLRFESFQGLREVVFLSLGENSTLIIDGDFNLGPGSRIIVEPGGKLYIGGRRNENLSGITERSRIMVRKEVHIGVDLICSWGVFITDCDWHEIIGHRNTEETVIGDHVWIAPNCSILKGSRIGDGCIIVGGSVIHRKSFPNGSLVGGSPACVLATNRHWNRGML